MDLPPAWLSEYCSACMAQLPTFNAKDLSHVLYAVARGRYAVPEEWITACMAEAEKVSMHAARLVSASVF
jgi:hypothetical protein